MSTQKCYDRLPGKAVFMTMTQNWQGLGKAAETHVEARQGRELEVQCSIPRQGSQKTRLILYSLKLSSVIQNSTIFSNFFTFYLTNSNASCSWKVWNRYKKEWMNGMIMVSKRKQLWGSNLVSLSQGKQKMKTRAKVLYAVYSIKYFCLSTGETSASKTYIIVQNKLNNTNWHATTSQ